MRSGPAIADNTRGERELMNLKSLHNIKKEEMTL